MGRNGLKGPFKWNGGAKEELEKGLYYSARSTAEKAQDEFVLESFGGEKENSNDWFLIAGILLLGAGLAAALLWRRQNGSSGLFGEQ